LVGGPASSARTFAFKGSMPSPVLATSGSVGTPSSWLNLSASIP
jgi:hypothetical protein